MANERRSFLTALGGLLGLSAVKPVTAKASPIEEISQSLLRDITLGCTLNGSVSTQTVLSALGSHAGYGCQMAVRSAVKQGLIPANNAFVEAETEDGSHYYFGDQLNQPLLEAQISVWGLVAGAAQKAGAKSLPDIQSIVTFVAQSIGTEKFGTLRVPAEYQPFEKPIESLKRLWSSTEKRLEALSYDPLMTGWYFANAAQTFILENKSRIEPGLAAQITMEAAVAMAKIDPKMLA